MIFYHFDARDYSSDIAVERIISRDKIDCEDGTLLNAIVVRSTFDKYISFIDLFIMSNYIGG